jgi:predicted DNA-binding protein
MNLDKWKSVLLPREVYEEIKVIAKVEGRTISGQLRWIFSYWKKHNLSDKDKEYIATEALRNKPQTVPDNPTRSFSV